MTATSRVSPWAVMEDLILEPMSHERTSPPSTSRSQTRPSEEPVASLPATTAGAPITGPLRRQGPEEVAGPAVEGVDIAVEGRGEDETGAGGGSTPEPAAGAVEAPDDGASLGVQGVEGAGEGADVDPAVVEQGRGRDAAGGVEAPLFLAVVDIEGVDVVVEGAEVDDAVRRDGRRPDPVARWEAPPEPTVLGVERVEVAVGGADHHRAVRDGGAADERRDIANLPVPQPAAVLGEGVHDAVVAAEVYLSVRYGRLAIDGPTVLLADEVEVPYLCAALQLDGPEVAVHGAHIEGLAVDDGRGPALGYAYARAGDQEHGSGQEGEQPEGRAERRVLRTLIGKGGATGNLWGCGYVPWRGWIPAAAGMTDVMGLL